MVILNIRKSSKTPVCNYKINREHFNREITWLNRLIMNKDDVALP